MIVKLNNKKIIFKRLSIILSLILLITMSYGYYCFKEKQDIENKNLLATEGGAQIDADSIELKADLERLTNVSRYKALEEEMAGSSEGTIVNEALKRGIIVAKGLIIDIDKLVQLKEKEGKSDSEIIDEAKSRKIIRIDRQSKINQIDIDGLKKLKESEPDKTDDEIVSKALIKGIIKGEFKYTNLEIDTNLDFNQLKPSSLGDYSDNECYSLDNFKDISGMEDKVLSEIGVDGGETEAKYKLDLSKNPISAGDGDCLPRDVVFIVDTNMNENAASNMGNGIFNEITNNKEFVGNTQGTGKNITGDWINDHFCDNDDRMNINIIPYHTKVAPSGGGQKYKHYCTSITKNDYRDYVRQMAQGIFGDCKQSNVDLNDTMNMALNEADEWFNKMDERHIKDKKSNSAKTIVIISSEISDEEFSECQLDNKYNIVTLFTGGTNGDKDYEVGYGESAEREGLAHYSNLKSLHKKLGGLDSNFNISYKESIYSNTHNDIESPVFSLDGIKLSHRLAKKLLDASFGNRYVSTEATVNFNLGKDIRISKIDESGATTTKNSNNEQLVSIKIPSIELNSDYSIIGDEALNISDEFTEDMVDNIIRNTRSSGISIDDLTIYLSRRLVDLTKITIEDSHSEEIVGDLYSSVLNKTLDELNKANGYKIMSPGGDKGLINKEDYDKMKDMKVLSILRIDTKDESNIMYKVIQVEIKKLISDKIKTSTNKVLGKLIISEYDTNVAAKDAIVQDILNNNDSGAKNKIKSLTNASDSRVKKILDNIKLRFSSNSTIKDIELYLSQETRDLVKDSSGKKISDFLRETTPELREEISSVLNRKLNSPLGLVQTTYRIESESSTVKIIVEPTVKAAFDESKTSVRFLENTKKNKNNNYISYSNKSNSTSINKTAPIDSIPILNLDRDLARKNHIVYGKIENKIAKELENYNGISATSSSGSSFAKGSVVTLASNITDISSEKTVYLTIDKNMTVKQTPTMYVIDESDDRDLHLKLLENVNVSEENTSEGIKYSFNLNLDSIQNVLIVYSVQLSENPLTYKNTVNVSGLSQGDGNLSIQATKELPDLF